MGLIICPSVALSDGPDLGTIAEKLLTSYRGENNNSQKKKTFFRYNIFSFFSLYSLFNASLCRNIIKQNETPLKLVEPHVRSWNPAF